MAASGTVRTGERPARPHLAYRTDVSQRPVRLRALTGARFVAAFLVFVFHVATIGAFPLGSGVARVLDDTTKTAGSIGVSFFFVLSGFVLCWSARPGQGYGAFLRRRVVKIFPNHVVTYCAAMLAFAAAMTPPGTAVLNLVLLQAWNPNPDVFLSVNGASWSLSCELFFYALFPLLITAVRRIPDRALWPAAGTLAALVLALPALAQLLPQGTVFDPARYGTVLGGESITRLWLLYIFPPVRLLDFVLGILMAQIVLKRRWIGLPVPVAALLAVAGYVVGLKTSWLVTVDAATVVPLALLVAALGAREAGGRAPALLTNRTAQLLGEASFAFYLVHGIVLTWARERLGDRLHTVGQGVLFAVVCLLVSLGLSLALMKVVEEPLMRRFARRRPRAARDAGAVSGAEPTLG